MFRKTLGLVFVAFAGLCSSSLLFAADVPGGFVNTGDILPTNTYELLISPAYTISPTAGAYLTSEIRYQPNEDFGAGFGFGAGEIGFHFGVHGTWYVSADSANSPAVGILGGLYFDRLNQENYFIVKAAPVISKTLKVAWGKITPYAAMHLTPSFRLGVASNEFAVKTSIGSEFINTNLNGVRLWTELGINIVNDVDEIVVGLSYPFTAL